MLELSLLDNVAPVSHQSFEFVLRVDIVEHGELWSKHEHKVSKFSVSEEVADEELLMEDHFISPVGVNESGVLSEALNG